MAAAMYLLSGFLDAFDGHAARLLNQGEMLPVFFKVGVGIFLKVLLLLFFWVYGDKQTSRLTIMLQNVI